MPPRTRTRGPSPEAAELIASGAAPTEVDAGSLLAQIQKLQGQVNAMQADRGVPSDPVAAALKNLRDHYTARRQMHARKEDLDELGSLLDELDASTTDSDETLFLLDVANAVPQTVEGHEYLRQLTRDLHGAVRRREDESEEAETDAEEEASEDE